MYSFFADRSQVVVSILILSLALFLSFFVLVSAESKDDIEFPIAELGGCENERECKTYCDDLDHMNECIAFAEAHNLMSREEIDHAKKFARAGGEGPGACSNRDECEAYCEDISNINECLAFAEEHDVLAGEELEEARRVSRALADGAKLPGGCRNKRECEAYCEDGNNIDECLAFAEKAGFLPPEELEHARKFSEFMKRGETPGGCRGRNECEAFCEDEANFEECSQFALRAGLLSPEEEAMLRRTGGKGPGGCRGRAECEAFCENPGNQEQCFSFAKEHGLIDEEELRHMEEGRGRLNEALSQAPPGVLECLRDRIGPDNLEALQSGNITKFTGDRGNIEREIEGCFREGFGPGSGEDRDDFGPNSGPGGSGGFGDFVGSASPEVIDCVRSQIGGDFEEALRGGRTERDIRPIVNDCFNEFAPHESEGGQEGFGDHPGERRDGPGEDFRQGIPEEFRDRIPEEFRGQAPEEFRDRIPEGFRDGIPEEFFDGRDGFRGEESRAFSPEEGHEGEVERRFEEEFGRQVEESFRQEIDRQFQQEFDRQFEEEVQRRTQGAQGGFNSSPGFEGQSPEGFGDTNVRDFPNPSDFAPENFNQQGASPYIFIINR